MLLKNISFINIRYKLPHKSWAFNTNSKTKIFMLSDIWFKKWGPSETKGVMYVYEYLI